MPENYKPNGSNSEISKTRVGSKQTKQVRSSSFLPEIFNTTLNKKLLDSTFDQLLHKGELENISAYIGSTKGKHRNDKDIYTSNDTQQLVPGVVSTDTDGNIENLITFKDIVKKTNNRFDSFNYAGAYASNSKTFLPPINIDKFRNHTSYYWVPEVTGGSTNENDVVFEKDYILIEQDGTTAWSTDNHWYHISDTAIQYQTTNRQAKRPIIEFDKDLELITGLEKDSTNQPPLFMLYDTDGIALNNTTYDTPDFTGSKIIGYKESDVYVDSVLGLPVAYSDNAFGGNIIFENFLETTKYHYVDSDENTVEITGQYYYKKGTNLTTNYQYNKSQNITSDSKQIIVDDLSTDVQFDVPGAVWRNEKEHYLVTENGKQRLVELNKDIGHYTFIDSFPTGIVLESNTTHTIHNFVAGTELRVWRFDDDFNTPISDASGTFDVPSDIQTLSFGFAGTIIGTIFIQSSQEIDNASHKLYLNGTPIDATNYYINDVITVNPEILQIGDVLDLEYQNNVGFNVTDIPEIIVTNTLGTKLTEFTIADTLSHWDSLLEGTCTGTNISGGDIRIFDNNILYNAISESHDHLDVHQVLDTTATDWMAFKGRFISQVKRNWMISTNSNITDLVDIILNDLTLIKEGIELYNNENMITGVKHIPDSIASLGITNLYMPQRDNDNIIGHDGDVYHMAPDANIVDMNTSNYDVVAAALLELESRIYNNVSTRANITVAQYMPSPYISTWYSITDVNDYLYQNFASWQPIANITKLGAPDVSDIDGWTWNYSSLDVNGYSIPGHWSGIYITLFGTDTPHLTPWHMLGFSIKPTWWDTYYSWTDLTKRSALILSLARGVTSVPGEAETINLLYARDWDFDTNTPVDIQGDLISPKELLAVYGSDTMGSEKFNPFKFGDHGPVETKWRKSSFGQASLINCISKIIPSTVWNILEPGVIQAQENFILKNRYDTDISQIYNNIETRLIHCLYGFTSSDLIKLYTESGANGEFRLSSNDYNIHMSKGAPNELITASAVVIVKLASGYQIFGQSPNKQQFEFNEQYATAGSKFEIVEIGNTSVRKYSKFYSRPSVLEFGSILNKAQDVYNFLRGYVYRLNNVGFSSDKLNRNYSNNFVQWMVTADIKHSLTLSLGNDIVYKPQHGSVVEFNTLPNNKNGIYDIAGNKIPTTLLDISRLDGNIQIKVSDQTKIGSISTATIDYQHAIVFDNHTMFNDIIHDDIVGIRHQRFKLIGQKTINWDGRQQAPGFLISGDHIIQNFDTSVGAISDFYDLSVSKLKNSQNMAERYTVGESSSQWSADQQLTNNTLSKFHRGMIRHKGTAHAVTQLDRSGLLMGLDGSSIKVNESWMFRQGKLGIDDSNRTEIELRQHEIKNKNQIIYFNPTTSASTYQTESSKCNVIDIRKDDILDTDNRYVHYIDNLLFDTELFGNGINNNLKLYTAGEVLENETTEAIFSLEDIGDVFDASAEYANTPTWNNTISYKDGDLVRHQGNLYSCIVNNTGLDLINDDIIELGNNRNPTFSFGTTAQISTCDLIDPTCTAVTVIFGNSITSHYDINITGSTFNPITTTQSSNIALDNHYIDLATVGFANVFASNPSFESTYIPAFTDASGKTLIIDNTTYDLFYTASVPNETLNGDGVQQYTTDTTTTTQTSAPIAATSMVDGIEYTIAIPGTTDFTVYSAVDSITGTVFTYNGVAVVGDGTVTFEETITTTTQVPTVITGTSTFTLSQELGLIAIVATGANNINVYVDSVQIDGTLLDASQYTINSSLDTIEFVTVPLTGTVITVIFGYTNPMAGQELITRINEQTPPSTLSFSINSDGMLKVIKDVNGDVNGTLSIGNGTANTDLGISENVIFATSQSEPAYISTTLDNIISKIEEVNISGLTVSNVGGSISIISTNTALSISGSVDILSSLGLTASTHAASTYIEQSPDTLDSAITKLRSTYDPLDTGVIEFTNISGFLEIKTSLPFIDLGDTAFNVQAGIIPGILSTLNSSVVNIFKDTDWEVLHNDPARISVHIVDDTSFMYNSLEERQVKYGSWNVFQFMTFGLFSDGDNQCTICAGNTTSDGNDAQITFNKSHNLLIGDYILILNSTTTPSIDGIHKVTKLHNSDNTTLFVDSFIEKCGTSPSILVARSMRFKYLTDIEDSLSSIYYSYQDGDLTWCSEFNDSTGTGVYAYDTGTVIQERTTLSRPTNADLDAIQIYNGDDKNLSFELEIFDPLRGIIPGVAQRNIDIISIVDFAAYTDSNDETDIDTENAWGESEIGKIWWDTSTVRYYDYDQGDLDYKSTHWAKQFSGSSIDVYEWIKSPVPPEEWEQLVDSKTIIYGHTAAGEVYTVIQDVTDEPYYYYSQLEQWNNKLGHYDTVYYFWVKNKSTITNKTKDLPVSQIAKIINDPTATGIGWCAFVDSYSIILSNVRPYLNDTNSILQIDMFTPGHTHSNWTCITSGIDLIPDYWYKGARDNLVGSVNNLVNSEIVYTRPLPNKLIHRFNQYGDDRETGQAWFTNLIGARREAIISLNYILKGINLLNTTPNWDNRLANYITMNAGPIPITSYWEYAAYETNEFNTSGQFPSLYLDRNTDIRTVDINKDTLVVISKHNDELGLSQDETYLFDNGVWHLIKKLNSTIQFNDLVYDIDGWDTTKWDSDTWNELHQDAMYHIMEAARYDMLINESEKYFNIWFFNIIDYVLSDTIRADWVYKTTYVDITVETPMSIDVKKYKRDIVSHLDEYITEVKPYHTKVRQYYGNNTIFDSVTTSISDMVDMESDIIFGECTENGECSSTFSYDSTFSGEEFSGAMFGEADPEETVEGATFDDSTVYEEYDCGLFSHTHNYMNDQHGSTRRLAFAANAHEHLALVVITNKAGATVDNDSRTFMYLQDTHSNVSAYNLPEINQSLLTTDLNDSTMSIGVTDISKFNTAGGYAMINGEILQYAQIINNNLEHITRGVNGTYRKSAAIGDTIINITNEKIATLDTIANSTNVSYISGLRFNDMDGDHIGMSLLDPGQNNIEPTQIQNSTKGISF
jgi:hypothetical protein